MTETSDSVRVESGTFQWESYRTTLLARALTIPVLDDERTIARYIAINDQAWKASTASKILNRLRAHVQRIQHCLPPLTEHERCLLRTLYRGDYDEMARLGVDIQYARLNKILTHLISKGPFVEIDTVSPYALNHLGIDGKLDVKFDNLPNDEKVGIHFGAILRDALRYCTNVRFVVLLDDFNSQFSDREFTVEERHHYVVEMGRILYEKGVLLRDDVPGKEYVLLQESTHADCVDQLILFLKSSERGVIEVDDLQGDVLFRPLPSFVRQLALRSVNRQKEFSRNGILLKRRGRPTCHALEAAGFLARINRQIIHLIVLDSRYIAQQDKTYALLRAIDTVTTDTYHNIFFDSNHLSQEVITYALCMTFIAELEKLFVPAQRDEERVPELTKQHFVE